MEALIYPLVEGGYLKFESLANGTVTWTDIIRARKLLEFGDWLQDEIKAQSTAIKKELEYFD